MHDSGRIVPFHGSLAEAEERKLVPIPPAQFRQVRAMPKEQRIDWYKSVMGGLRPEVGGAAYQAARNAAKRERRKRRGK